MFRVRKTLFLISLFQSLFALPGENGASVGEVTRELGGGVWRPCIVGDLVETTSWVWSFTGLLSGNFVGRGEISLSEDDKQKSDFSMSIVSCSTDRGSRVWGMSIATPFVLSTSFSAPIASLSADIVWNCLTSALSFGCEENVHCFCSFWYSAAFSAHSVCIQRQSVKVVSQSSQPNCGHEKSLSMSESTDQEGCINNTKTIAKVEVLTCKGVNELGTFQDVLS